MRLAVVGGGWAGLAAAVRAVQAGHRVTLFEMAAQPGGRARTVGAGGTDLDNGQHILIGAYRRTLALMAEVGVDTAAAFDRRPLELRFPDGRGLRLPPGPAALSFARGVLHARGWTLQERFALLASAAGWAAGRFRCEEAWTVAELCAALPTAVRTLLIDPLCVAALNTPAHEASAAVLLRVLRDALFGGRGGADLLLPRVPLSELLPAPAQRWLCAHGALWHAASRVQAVDRDGPHWRVTLAHQEAPGGAVFDAVVLACTAAEAARLAAPHAPGWSAIASGLRHEPIVTVYLHCPDARLPAPMTALHDGPEAPAQFAFDHGALGGAAGRFAFVASGAATWVEAGANATARAVLRQAEQVMSAAPRAPEVLRVLAEKRATFRCTPALERPPPAVAPGLLAAGDYVAGPYPATLEAAVQSGEAAIAALTAGAAG